MDVIHWASTRRIVSIKLDGKTFLINDGIEQQKTSFTPTPSSSSSSILTTTSFIRRCRICGIEFQSIEEHRSHFTSTIHLNTISKASQQEEEQETESEEAVENEEEEEIQDEEEKVSCRTPTIELVDSTNESRLIWRTCIEGLTGIELDSQCENADLKITTTFTKFLQILRSGERRISKWAVILCRSGFFAASILDGLDVLKHKTFRRYTSRKKQGGTQSNKDAQGVHAQSAGAAIRRHHEKRYVEIVHEIFKEWSEDLSINSCSLVFVSLPKVQRNGKLLFFDGSPFNENEFRIRKVPFTTSRPSFAETIGVHRCLFTLSLIENNQKLGQSTQKHEQEKKEKETIENELPMIMIVKSASLDDIGKLILCLEKFKEQQNLTSQEQEELKLALKNALVSGCKAGSFHCVNELLKFSDRNKNSIIVGTLDIVYAVKSGNVELVRLLIEKIKEGNKIDFEKIRDENGQSLLEIAPNEIIKQVILSVLNAKQQSGNDDTERKKKEKKEKAKTRKENEKKEQEQRIIEQKTKQKQQQTKKISALSTTTNLAPQKPMENGVECFQCGKMVEMVVSFEVMGNRFCSISCVQQHKNQKSK